jgi:hypothetical protein
VLKLRIYLEFSVFFLNFASEISNGTEDKFKTIRIMATFDFYQDQHVKIWERVHFRIEADSKEEAIEKVKQYKDKDVAFEFGTDSTEMLYDTEEVLEPQNDGEPTLQIYDDYGKLICDNSINE